jgi:hypothetical protein
VDQKGPKRGQIYLIGLNRVFLRELLAGGLRLHACSNCRAREAASGCAAAVKSLTRTSHSKKNCKLRQLLHTHSSAIKTQPLWRGSLLPLGCAATPKPATAHNQDTASADLRLLRSRTGASSLATIERCCGDFCHDRYLSVLLVPNHRKLANTEFPLFGSWGNHPCHHRAKPCSANITTMPLIA